MPVYPGKKKGEHRVRIWSQGEKEDWIIKGSKKDAEAYEARKRIEIEQGKALHGRVSPILRDFCLEKYEPWAKLHVKRSWRSRKYQIATLLTTKLDKKGTTLGDKRLTELVPAILALYQEKRALLVANISVNNEIAVLQAIITFAVEIESVPTTKFKCPPLPVGERRVTCWDQLRIDTFFEACESEAPKLLPLCVCIANTGCRKGEAMVAESSWVDLEAEMFRLPATEYWRPKNGKPRDVPISDSFSAWLTSERLAQRFLFPSEDGTRYANFPDKTFGRVVKVANRLLCAKECPGRKDKAKCDRRCPTMRGGPHTLRHTYASHFLMAEPDMFLLSQVLGHSETRTTKLYAHLLKEHLQRARNKVNLAPGISAAAWRAARVWEEGQKRNRV